MVCFPSILIADQSGVRREEILKGCTSTTAYPVEGETTCPQPVAGKGGISMLAGRLRPRGDIGQFPGDAEQFIGLCQPCVAGLLRDNSQPGASNPMRPMREGATREGSWPDSPAPG